MRPVRVGIVAILLASSSVSAQQRVPPCGQANPRIGRLEILSGPMWLHRSERDISLSAVSVDLCASDQIRTVAGEAIATIDRNRQRLVAGRIYTFAPYSGRHGTLALLADELRARFGGLVSVARARMSASHGSGEIQFQVAGLEDGDARIAAGARALQVRFAGNGRNFRATLSGPDRRVLPGRLADDPATRLWRVIFPEADFQPGERWTITITGEYGSVDGSFTVVEGPLVVPAEANGLPEDDRAVLGALLLAADDVDRWSFEAFQWISGRPSSRFREEDAEYLLWHWAGDPWAVPRWPEPERER